MPEVSQRQYACDRVLLVVPVTLLHKLLRRFPQLVTVLLFITVLDVAAMLAMPGLLGAAVAALDVSSPRLWFLALALAIVMALPMLLGSLRSWFSQLLFVESYAWCSKQLVDWEASETQKEARARELDGWQFEVVHESVFTEVAQRIVGLVAVVALLRFDVLSVLVLFVGYRLLGRAFSLWRQSFYDLPPAERELSQRRGYVWGLLTSRVSAAELRIFAMRDFLESVMAKDATDANRRVWGKRGRGDRAMFAGYAVVAVGMGMLLWRTLEQTLRGGLDASDIATMFGWLALAGFIGLLGDPEFFSANALKIYREFETGSTKTLEPVLLPPVPGAPALELRDVHFSYGAIPILKGIDLRVEPGERVAVVGTNGAGKTTMLRLLLGDLTPDAGTAEVFGRSPRDAATHVGAVFQDFAKFPLSLAENIAAGSMGGDVSQRAMGEALEQVGLSDTVRELPDGTLTLLDPTQEDGIDLSGGQWQRLAMARALAREMDHEGDFLFAWDEPTSQLDPISEADILRDFTRITSGHACLVVTHRLGSVRHMDRVVVIADGVVAEDGTHEQLMASRGHYWAMFTAQAANYKEAG